MKKDTYLRKLESTKVVDTMTVAEAKKAKRVERTLRKFWERAALFYAEQVTREIDNAANIYTFKFDYNLKPTGTVKIEVWFSPAGFGDVGRDELVKRVSVPKRFLLT